MTLVSFIYFIKWGELFIPRWIFTNLLHMRERERETISSRCDSEVWPLLKYSTDFTWQVTAPCYDSKLLKLRSWHFQELKGRTGNVHPFLQTLSCLVLVPPQAENNLLEISSWFPQIPSSSVYSILGQILGCVFPSTK